MDKHGQEMDLQVKGNGSEEPKRALRTQMSRQQRLNSETFKFPQKRFSLGQAS